MGMVAAVTSGLPGAIRNKERRQSGMNIQNCITLDEAAGAISKTTGPSGDGNMLAGDAKKTFERVRAQLKARLGKEVYASWFERMKLVEATSSVARLSVPTTFLRSWTLGWMMIV